MAVSDVATETGASPTPFSDGEYRLIVARGPDEGRHLQLTVGEHFVGKSPECGLVLTDTQVSRRHLRVRVSPEGVRVRDLDSKNGSFLGGSRIVETYLLPGAALRIGRSELRLVSTWATTARSAKGTTAARTSIGRLHGWSAAMREVFTLIEHASRSGGAVLVEGETGCGKELCAHAIHLTGPRAAGPFVLGDMGAVPASLIESELFGHVRGAFTGAHADREGLFREADGGTLFLDEIGELDLALQPRLLRAIEQHRFRPVGADTYRMSDLRVVAATNRPLETEVKEGRFRADLFYRLAVVRIRMPPLRQRKEDIPHLVRLFLGARDVELAAETMAVLSEHDWPGNVRELENTVERALSRLPPGERVIDPAMLGLDTPSSSPDIPWPRLGEADFVSARDRMVAAWERHYLEQLLERCRGNVSLAAREGGIDRVYLHRLLKRHEITARRQRLRGGLPVTRP